LGAYHIEKPTVSFHNPKIFVEIIW
jgi:hypothetical protein